MKIIIFLRDLGFTVVLVFIVSSIVSYIYSLIAHGVAVPDWETSIRFAVILGIILPTIKAIENRSKD